MKTEPPAPRLEYPAARRGDQVDDYHGTRVPDPYRWLEDPDSDETRAWIEAQGTLTYDGYLDRIDARERIEARLTEVWNYERYGAPSKKGGRYFFSKNDGLQDQSVYYWAESLDAEPTVLFDPNTWSEDGTVSLAALSISDDGTLAAYGISDGGSDWVTWKVREIDTGVDRPDVLRWSKFSGGAWTKDGKGFYYSRYPEPQEGADLTGALQNQALYYHRLGDPQDKDQMVLAFPEQPKWGIYGQITDDGRYLVATVWETGPKNLLYYKDLSKKDAGFVPLISEWKHDYSLIDNDGPVFWISTDDGAPRKRLIAIDIRKPQPEHWKELVPQSKDTLQSFSRVGDRIFADYLRDARSRVLAFDLEGEPLGEVALPGIGSVSGFGGRRGDDETFYLFTSFTQPATIYRYELATGASTVWREPEVDVDPSAYEAKQVFYESKDGTRVPMFIVHKKGLVLDGSNPTLLYGYGGFNISLTPFFSLKNEVWMAMGGVYAMPNLRGGAEYGEEWHQAGTKANKQNVFDDFIAAAEYLIDNGYTRSEKLAINGSSNGGLLVGAVMTQRPELFGAAIPDVGVMDMLRFHTFTIGRAWVYDYGSSDDPEEFKALHAYSPYHNLRPGTCYPATMVVTADRDDRVVPAHSFKFAAALQHAQGCDKPALIRIQTRAGHGAGTPTKVLIRQVADVLAFLSRALAIEVPETL